MRLDHLLKDGYSILHYAALTTPEIVKLLLDHGAKASVANADGVTPLHTSASGGISGSLSTMSGL